MRSSRTSRSISVSISSRLRSPRPWASRSVPPPRPPRPRRGSQQARDLRAARELFEAVAELVVVCPDACLHVSSEDRDRVRLHVLDAVGAQLAAQRRRRLRGDHAVGAVRGEIGGEPVRHNAVRRGGAVDAREIAVAFDDLVGGGEERLGGGIQPRHRPARALVEEPKTGGRSARALRSHQHDQAALAQRPLQIGQAGHGRETVANCSIWSTGTGPGAPLTSARSPRSACRWRSAGPGSPRRSPGSAGDGRPRTRCGWPCRRATPNRCSPTADRTGRLTYRCRRPSGSSSRLLLHRRAVPGATPTAAVTHRAPPSVGTVRRGNGAQPVGGRQSRQDVRMRVASEHDWCPPSSAVGNER